MPQSAKTNPPPDSRQIASSNETLNTFLGGRTRSWMTGGSVTNPRPAAPVAPSNSRKRNKKRKASDTAPQTQNDNDIERDNIPTDHSSEQPPGAGEIARAPTVLPSPALTDAPSPNGSNQFDCTNPDSSAHVESEGPGRPVSNRNMNQGDSVHVANNNTNQWNPTDPSPTQVDSSLPRRTYAVEAVTSSAVANPIAPAQIRQGTGVPLSTDNIQHNPAELSGTSTRVHSRSSIVSEHQAKRPRVQATSSSEETANQRICRQWSNSIERRVEQAARAGLLNENTEQPRYRILKEACADEDFFYIAFHQALCAWSLNKEPVHVLFNGLLEPGLLDFAFEIMQTILRKNDNMSTSHLQWFANFPTTIAEFSRVFPNTAAARDIAAFLYRMTSNWRTLLQTVQTRKYPFLAYELTHFLHCRGRGLQSMLFTMSRRTICPDGAAAKVMNRIFEQDRLDEAIYDARGEAPEVLKSAREAVAAKHKQAILSQLQVSSNTIPSPVAGQNSPMTEQNGLQPVAQSPLTASMSPRARNTTTPPVSLPRFDALASRASIGSSGATSPMTVDQALPQPSGGLQGARRPNNLHIQTGNATALPLSVPVGQSPLAQHQSLPRSSSAGSPMTSQNRVLPSNGQSRTPVLPSNDLLPQRRANSFAFPSQGPPSVHETNTQSPPMHPHSAGIPQVSSASQMTHPHQTRAMHSPQYPSAYTQSNLSPRISTPQNHNNAVRQMVPRNPPYQVPVSVNQARQTPLVQQMTEADYPSSPYGHGSLQVGLQHIEVRSPRRVPSYPGKGRFYQFVRQLVYEPVAVEPQRGLRSLSFTVPESHIRQLSRKTEGIGLPFCYYSEGSYRYRLRMCTQPETQATPTESDWVVTPTSWPGHIFFDLNKQHLELRRKQHFNKDQPLELTDILHEGDNVLRISFPPLDQNTIPGYKYFMAIEIVETISHDAVRNVVQSLRHIPAEETRAKIQSRLRPSDSDDIIIEDETLTISLADPFSATRFTEPVRGSQCKHLECFDLETWLQTRPPKPPQKGGGPQHQGGEPSMVDVWKCPICSLDARPGSLWVDGYLAGVRRSLLSNGDMRTKTITVAADGKWSPVVDADDTDDDSTPAPQARNTVNTTVGKQSRTSSLTAAPPTVIEILDDD